MQSWGHQTFSVKDQMVDIVDFLDHVISLSFVSTEASIHNSIQMHLCSSKTLFSKIIGHWQLIY